MLRSYRWFLTFQFETIVIENSARQHSSPQRCKIEVYIVKVMLRDLIEILDFFEKSPPGEVWT
jgi:hypothetical protein